MAALHGWQYILFCGASVAALITIIFIREERVRPGLWLLFLAGLLLGLFMASLDPFLSLWDEQFHALVAKNMSTRPFRPVLYPEMVLPLDFRNWTANHIWVHKPPLFLWEMALSIRLFGCNEMAVRLPSVFMHALTALMIFRMGVMIVNRNTGLYGGLLFLFAYYPLELLSGALHTDHNDTAFLFQVCASFWAMFEYEHSGRRLWIWVIGLVAGGAVLVKWLPGLLVFPAWSLARMRRDSRFRSQVATRAGEHAENVHVDNPQKATAGPPWRKTNYIKKDLLIRLQAQMPVLAAAGVALVAAAPWFIYIFIRWPQEAAFEIGQFGRHAGQVIEDHGGGFFYHIRALNTLYGGGQAVPYLAGLALTALGIRAWRHTAARAALLGVVILYLFYSLMATKMTAYCLPAAPFVFLALGSLIEWLLSQSGKLIRNRWAATTLAVTVLAVTSYLSLDLNRIMQNRLPGNSDAQKFRMVRLNEMQMIHSLPEVLGEGPWVIFNPCPWGYVPIMFYTKHLSYPGIPSEEQVRSLLEQGKRIAVFRQDEPLPAYINENSEIRVIGGAQCYY
ncbi:MAG: glycosyltransferase family 39 protein [Bacteroidales bacterium]|nr:glycosyltransferase family 39 protein [Bacteroidales bacterium]